MTLKCADTSSFSDFISKDELYLVFNYFYRIILYIDIFFFKSKLLINI